MFTLQKPNDLQKSVVLVIVKTRVGIGGEGHHRYGEFEWDEERGGGSTESSVEEDESSPDDVR